MEQDFPEYLVAISVLAPLTFYSVYTSAGGLVTIQSPSSSSGAGWAPGICILKSPQVM